MTAITNPMASSRVNCTSATEARIVSVRSDTTVQGDAGRQRVLELRQRGCWMSATVCTMLAPGWRWMSRMTAGLAVQRGLRRGCFPPLASTAAHVLEAERVRRPCS